MIRKISILFVVAFISGILSGTLLGMNRDEILRWGSQEDVYSEAVLNAVKQVRQLKGLSDSKRVGVLMVRDLQGREKKLPTTEFNSKWYEFSKFIPVFGWFASKTYVPWAVGTDSYTHIEQDANVIHRNVALEDAIINELAKSSQYSVVESIQPFYTQLGKLGSAFESKSESEGKSAGKSSGDSGNHANTDYNSKQKSLSVAKLLYAFKENPLSISRIGKELGVDTILIGSTIGMKKKKIIEDSFWTTKKYLITKYALNIRTIDVKTNKVTSSRIIYGRAQRRISSRTNWMNVLYFGATIAIYNNNRDAY